MYLAYMRRGSQPELGIRTRPKLAAAGFCGGWRACRQFAAADCGRPSDPPRPRLFRQPCPVERKFAGDADVHVAARWVCGTARGLAGDPGDHGRSGVFQPAGGAADRRDKRPLDRRDCRSPGNVEPPAAHAVGFRPRGVSSPGSPRLTVNGSIRNRPSAKAPCLSPGRSWSWRPGGWRSSFRAGPR